MSASNFASEKSIRLWPGVIIVILQWLLVLLPQVFTGPGISAVGVLGGIAGGLALMIWWTFFSRAPRFERWGAIVFWIFALGLSSRLTHESIRTAGQGMMYFAHAIPLSSLGFVIWALACRSLSVVPRRLTMVATLLLTCGIAILFRSEGMSGDAGLDLAWRWSESNEERFLSQSGDEQMVSGPSPEIPGSGSEWPGFRGPERDNIISGSRIETDWSASPPVELWRRPVGPGCSSFAVSGGIFFTQEQHGDNEAVTSYVLASGKPVWKYEYQARFWDSHAGAGPRSTPELSNGLVATLGATGIVHVLNAVDGTLLWSQNAAADAKITAGEWGFSSSPLVLGEVVLIAISGKLMAYDIATGSLIWYSPDGGESFSSPHLFTIDGVEQVVMMSESGAVSFMPGDGEMLWEHPMQGARIVQPARCSGGDFILDIGGAKGLCRVKVSSNNGEWFVEEAWRSFRLRPNFNDFVVHKGHAYGFEGPSLACLDLEDGKRKWKGGRYGGQILLLEDQDLLLVLTEKGEVVLVEAVPERMREIGRIQAIEGKTWNHPVLIGNILLVRNSQEMAAFRLPLADE